VLKRNPELRKEFAEQAEVLLESSRELVEDVHTISGGISKIRGLFVKPEEADVKAISHMSRDTYNTMWANIEEGAV
jgi:hypothetical protein